MKNRYIILSILLFSVACRKFEPYPVFSKLALKKAFVDLGTHKLATFSVIRNSNYLVVFESGLGDDHTIWNSSNIALKAADTIDVVTYDRANRGQSGNGPVPRDVARLQSELGSVIDSFANGRKVVLIGHSLGGFMIRAWAVNNPTKVAGMLFIDPSHEKAGLDSAQNQQAEDYMYGQWSSYGTNFGAALESREWVEDNMYMTTLGNLPDVPVIVLTAMKVDPPNTVEILKPWYDAHESLGTGVTDFTHVSIPNSGHMVMIDQPQILLNYIHVLLAKLH